MDKYEYQLKTEHIKQVAARKEYEEAARLCDTIDWTKVRDVKMLTFAADIYTAVGEYENAIDILQQAYEYTTMGRRIVYRLTELALKAGNYDEAKNYFEEFCRIAPNDQGRYILLYKMARFQKATLSEKIQILEAYKKEDFDEKWAYELAVLYAMNNEKDKCIQLCDDIILWFGLGKYVEKALSLKSQFAPLTAAQKEKAQKFADKKAQEENEKLQENQKKQEEQKQEAVQAQKKATQEKILKWQAEQEAAYKAEQEAAKAEAKAREEEQIAIREREEKLRLKREEEKALKEEREREEARKAAERLREQKEREEQERLQREQEELEAVERLKQAQKKEHSKLNVVTSDMNEIMAVIQRARQEDAQNDLQESLAKEIQEVQKQAAAEKVEKAEETSATEQIEEVKTETAPEAESEEVESDEIEEPEVEEIESEEAEEVEVEEPEAEEKESEEVEEPETEKIESEETDEMPEITSELTSSETLEEPQISEWAAPQAETVAFEEAEAADVAEATPVEIPLTEEEPEEYSEFEPESEEPEENPKQEELLENESEEPEEEVSEIDVEDDESTEVPKETESVEAEETQEVQQTTESDKESNFETPAEQYEEFRQTERVRADGLPIVNPENMSRVWHFAIQAMPDEDDIELALDYLQELSDSSSRVVPQSVVKITGQKLNQKGVVRSFDKLLGKTILIENAADMSDRVINELCQVIEPNDRSLLVVFIDTPSSIRHLLLDHPALSSVITAQFVRENYSVTELLEYARGYADREDSVLDKSGELALMERLKVIAENQERNKKRIVEMIVNNAIEKAEKKSVRRLFQSKYDKQGCLILRDKDFQVS